MRILFFGTSAFAIPSLRALVREHDVAGVVTQPDRPAGRGHKLMPTPIKATALELGLPVYEPQRLREFLPQAHALRPDAFAVASYGKILPGPLLALAPKGALNVHPSLLPLYRGATPLQSVLRDGRRETGITIFLMDAGMDTGDIVVQEPRTIAPEETFGELHDRLATDAAPLLLRALREIADGTAHPYPQAGLADEREIAATLTRPLRTTDFDVHWDGAAPRIVNQVRSLSPAPAARAIIAGVRVKVLRAHVVEMAVPLGAAHGEAIGIDRESVVIACGEGAIGVDRLTPPNKPPQSGAAFMRSAGR